MKKYFVLFCAVCTTIFLASSCSGITNLSVTPTASLGSNNFEYVRDVEGETTHSYVFGIGGMKEKNASDLLVKNANLKPGEALANISVLSKTKVYVLGIVVVKVIQAHAQVVRFTDGNQTISQESSYVPGSNLRATEEDDESVGDEMSGESKEQPQEDQEEIEQARIKAENAAKKEAEKKARVDSRQAAREEAARLTAEKNAAVKAAKEEAARIAAEKAAAVKAAKEEAARIAAEKAAAQKAVTDSLAAESARMRSQIGASSAR